MEWNGRRLEEWKTIIFPYFHTKELINWKQCNVFFVPLQSCKQPLEKVPEQYKDATTVSGVHIAHCLMRRHS